MKKIFVAVQVDYTGNVSPVSGKQYNGGHQAMYAFVEVFKAGDNLARRFDIIGGLVSATLCETRKQADDLVSDWNRGFRENGIYAF